MQKSAGVELRFYWIIGFVSRVASQVLGVSVGVGVGVGVGLRVRGFKYVSFSAKEKVPKENSALIVRHCSPFVVPYPHLALPSPPYVALSSLLIS